MSEVSYTTRDGRLRLYDGTATPYYLEIPFVNAGFSGPLGRGRGAQTIILDRGRLSTRMHYIEESDEAAIAGVEVSWSFKMTNTEPLLTKFKDALNVSQAATWTVGSHTWVTTKGTTQLLSGGATPTLYTTPTFTNAPRRRCINIEVLYVDPTASGGDTGQKYAECEAEPDKQMINEGDREVAVNVRLMCYGAITQITAFTAGNAG